MPKPPAVVASVVVPPGELKGFGQKPGVVTPQLSKIELPLTFRGSYTNELTQQPTSAIRFHSSVLQESVQPSPILLHAAILLAFHCSTVMS